MEILDLEDEAPGLIDADETQAEDQQDCTEGGRASGSNEFSGVDDTAKRQKV